MKNSRQNIILQIISEQEIETQSQLIEALAKRGVNSTQATLSRDMRELQLVKELSTNGKYHYTESTKSKLAEREMRLRKIFKESITSFAVAQNIIVLKTLPGLANAACATMDTMDIDNLVGTIAGDDTAFLAMTDNKSAVEFYNTIEKML